jgi:hypothetical protein
VTFLNMSRPIISSDETTITYPRFTMLIESPTLNFSDSWDCWWCYHAGAFTLSAIIIIMASAGVYLHLLLFHLVLNLILTIRLRSQIINRRRLYRLILNRCCWCLLMIWNRGLLHLQLTHLLASFSLNFNSLYLLVGEY